MVKKLVIHPSDGAALAALASTCYFFQNQDLQYVTNKQNIDNNGELIK